MRFFCLSIMLCWGVGCRPLEPSDTPRQLNQSSLTIALDSDSLRLDAGEAGFTRFSFSKDGYEPYAKRIAPFSYEAVTLSELQVGKQSLVIEVMDGDQALVAKAATTVDLVPGVQGFDQALTFTLRSFFTVQFALATKENPNRTVIYDDIEPIILSPEYGCASGGCHGFDGSENIHMDLRTFPFKSTRYKQNQMRIVQAILDRAKIPQGGAGRMPMGSFPSIAAEEQSLIQEWLDGGLMVERAECGNPMDWLSHLKVQIDIDGTTKEMNIEPNDAGELWLQVGAMASTLVLEGGVTLVNGAGDEVMGMPVSVELSPDAAGHVMIEVPCESRRGNHR